MKNRQLGDGMKDRQLGGGKWIWETAIPRHRLACLAHHPKPGISILAHPSCISAAIECDRKPSAAPWRRAPSWSWTRPPTPSFHATSSSSHRGHASAPTPTSDALWKHCAAGMAGCQKPAISRWSRYPPPPPRGGLCTHAYCTWKDCPQPLPLQLLTLF